MDSDLFWPSGEHGRPGPRGFRSIASPGRKMAPDRRLTRNGALLLLGAALAVFTVWHLAYLDGASATPQEWYLRTDRMIHSIESARKCAADGDMASHDAALDVAMEDATWLRGKIETIHAAWQAAQYDER